AVEFAPVNRQQVLTLADVHARFGQRSPQVGIPVLALIHAQKAIATVFYAVVGAQQADTDVFHLRPVSAKDVDVLRRDLAQHVAENIAEIGAAHDVVNIGLISRDQALHVGAVEVGIVEEVALNPPNFPVHLLPFGARINVYLHGIELERTVRLVRIRRLAQGVYRFDKPGAMGTSATLAAGSRFSLGQLLIES